MEVLKCPICGEATRVYMGKARKDRLCGKHADMLKAGELIANENGTFSSREEIASQNAKTEEQEIKKCLLCNEDSGNYLFCRSCFSKHHGKTLLFKITCDKNQKLELLNESYEGIYVCKDGHIVKSKSERDIDNYLFEHKIAHAYEKALPINGEIFKPDFYLKDLDVYIEHWGYDENNKEYTARKEYKIPKYKEKGITLICTYEATDMQDVETSLQIKLESYKVGEINFL